MQMDDTDLLREIIEKQKTQDEKLAYILNNQNIKLDALAKQIKKSKWSKFWNFVKRLFLFVLFFILLFALLRAIFSPMVKIGKIENIDYQHVAEIKISGTISAESATNSDSIINSLKRAFDNPKVKYIVLNINSPGGSPVQSAYIYETIMRIKSKKPVYAIVGDLAASGAYYIASAATEIYAHKSSLVGSIGVISLNFGVKELMNKLGIEARIQTAGENKAFLNQFEEVNPKEMQFWQELLDETHKEFIADVKQGRGNKLNTNADLFSGLIFSGKRSKQLGLIDELGNMYDLQQKLENLPFVNYTKKISFWDRLTEVTTKASRNIIRNASAPILN